MSLLMNGVTRSLFQIEESCLVIRLLDALLFKAIYSGRPS
jgi:hypothetical protein